VMSLISYIGTERNILDEAPDNCHTLKLPHPILTNRDLEKLRRVSTGDLLATTIPTLFRVADGEAGLKRSLEELSARASHAVDSGYTLLILSDRGVDPTYAAIPGLLAMAAVHNRLVQEKTRTQVALIIESGEPREVMHFALLIGYGASAVNPYLAFETIHDQLRQGMITGDADKAEMRYVKAVNKGIVKVMSKMGISAVQSYHGAQIFEALGLSQDFVDEENIWFEVGRHGTLKTTLITIGVIAMMLETRRRKALGVPLGNTVWSGAGGSSVNRAVAMKPTLLK